MLRCELKNNFLTYLMYAASLFLIHALPNLEVLNY